VIRPTLRDWSRRARNPGPGWRSGYYRPRALVTYPSAARVLHRRDLVDAVRRRDDLEHPTGRRIPRSVKPTYGLSVPRARMHNPMCLQRQEPYRPRGRRAEVGPRLLTTPRGAVNWAFGRDFPGCRRATALVRKENVTPTTFGGSRHPLRARCITYFRSLRLQTGFVVRARSCTHGTVAWVLCGRVVDARLHHPPRGTRKIMLNCTIRANHPSVGDE
jgi:hypothetical protein